MPSSRIKTATLLLETAILPIVSHNDTEVLKKMVEACYEGGIRVFEITNRGNFAHERFSELRKYALQRFPDMLIGAGTINDPFTATLYMQLGADFIVSPILNEETGRICNKRKTLWIPGCATLTEISKAEETGAEIVKLFPAQEIGGPEFVKNIKGPMPWSSLLITGGVELSEQSFLSWFNAGASCLGMGSKLFPAKEINNQSFEIVTQNIETALRIAQKTRVS